ncbi:MAG: SoxR reducing system RseC family protein [Candidatus Cloacimonadaceae bacterium]|nr:SoxR reducing system RseC family protein [Candidatus Cloacimonadaceae bacterium]
MEEPHIEDSGTVVSVQGNHVRVEVARGAGCKSCSMRGFCFSQNKPSVFDLETELDLSPGDKVELEISPGGRVVSALLIFAVPIVFLFAGFLISSQWLAELPSIGIAFLAMALSFIIIRYCDRNIAGSIKVQIGRKI